MPKEFKGIIFPEKLDCSFDEFVKQYGSCHVFKAIPSDVRDAELKEAFRIAVPNGSIKATAKESAKPNTSKGTK